MMGNETLWLFIRLIIVLPLVLALAYFTIKYGLARGRGFATTGTRHMRVVEHLPLGPKGGLALVEVGGRYYLMAFQENNVSLLKEFDTLPEQLKTSAIGAGGQLDFKEVLSQQLKGSQEKLTGLLRKGKNGSRCPERDQEQKK